MEQMIADVKAICGGALTDEAIRRDLSITQSVESTVGRFFDGQLHEEAAVQPPVAAPQKANVPTRVFDVIDLCSDGEEDSVHATTVKAPSRVPAIVRDADHVLKRSQLKTPAKIVTSNTAHVTAVNSGKTNVSEYISSTYLRSEATPSALPKNQGELRSLLMKPRNMTPIVPQASTAYRSSDDTPKNSVQQPRTPLGALENRNMAPTRSLNAFNEYADAIDRLDVSQLDDFSKNALDHQRHMDAFDAMLAEMGGGRPKAAARNNTAANTGYQRKTSRPEIRDTVSLMTMTTTTTTTTTLTAKEQQKQAKQLQKEQEKQRKEETKRLKDEQKRLKDAEKKLAAVC
jgi:hypothetical protein